MTRLSKIYYAGLTLLAVTASGVLVGSRYLELGAAASRVPSNTWAATGDLAKGRTGAASVLLYDGHLLVTGGTAPGGVTGAVERYSP